MEAMKRALANLNIRYQELANGLQTVSGIFISQNQLTYDRFQQTQVDKIMSHYAKEVVVDWANQHNFFIEQTQNELEFNLVQY